MQRVVFAVGGFEHEYLLSKNCENKRLSMTPDNYSYRQVGVSDRLGGMPKTPIKSTFAARDSKSGESAGQAVLVRAEEAPEADRASPAVAALGAWDAMAQGAYPSNTLRAWRADWSAFRHFCLEQNQPCLPASPHTVRAYVQHCMSLGKKPATIRRYLATITRAHRAADLLTPCSSEPVRLALKAMSRAAPGRQRQARALGWSEIKVFLETAGEGIRADRERALLCVAYDTMARRSELVALNLEDLKFAKDGTGTALIRRSKTDQEGQGAQAYLSRETIRHLKSWLKAAELREGAVFRRLIGRARVGERLSADSIADLFKRVARWIKLPGEEVAAISGHSTRVGAAQDLLGLNIDLASVMQTGRWKSVHMPMRYGEHILASRGAMARAATAQERNS